MSNIHQNTLYLITPGSYVSRDHLTLRVEVEKLVKLAVPIHHLESVCVFGPSTISPPALALCWEHDVAVNFLSEHGYFQARMIAREREAFSMIGDDVAVDVQIEAARAKTKSRLFVLLLKGRPSWRPSAWTGQSPSLHQQVFAESNASRKERSRSQVKWR